MGTWGAGAEIMGRDEILQKEKSRKVFKTDFREFKGMPIHLNRFTFKMSKDFEAKKPKTYEQTKECLQNINIVRL